MRNKIPTNPLLTMKLEVSVRLSHPKDLGKGNIGFVVTWIKEPSQEELAVETGWRIFRGFIVPPSQQDKRGKWFSTITPHPQLIKAMDTLVQEWKPMFPEIQFPGAPPEVGFGNATS